MEHTVTQKALLLPEVATSIFQYMPLSDLLQGRLVCRNFKDMIDAFSINDKLDVSICDQTMNEEFKPTDLLPWKTTTHLTMKSCKITAIDHWWPTFGKRLITLRLHRCTITIPILRYILRLAPKLKCLEILDVELPDADNSVQPGTDLLLIQLEKFSIKTESPHSMEAILEVCGPEAFPHLKSFKFRSSSNKVLEQAYGVIGTLQDSLEELDFHLKGATLRALIALPWLLLKRLWLSIADDTGQENTYLTDYWPWKVHGKQIEQLSVQWPICTTNEALLTIGSSCPNLNRLSIRFCRDEVVHKNAWLYPKRSFFNAMPKLEHLSIFSYNEIIDLENHGGPGLRSFSAQGYRFDEPSQFLSNSRNIQRLELSQCTVSSLQELFSGIEMLGESLRYLRLADIEFEDQRAYMTTKVFPGLTELAVVRLHSKSTDEVVLTLLEKAENLRKLTLCHAIPQISECLRERYIQYRIEKLNDTVERAPPARVPENKSNQQSVLGISDSDTDTSDEIFPFEL